MIGQEIRDQLEESIAKFDPFNRNRKEEIKFFDKSRGGPFAGVTMESLLRFIENKKREYKLKCRDQFDVSINSDLQ